MSDDSSELGTETGERGRFRVVLAFVLGGLLVWTIEAMGASCAGSGVLGL